jgi:hypothetical protein
VRCASLCGREETAASSATRGSRGSRTTRRQKFAWTFTEGS